MNLKDNKNFCILPWIHLNTQPNGDVYQCCMAPYRTTCGSTTSNTLEEIWNNDYMKTLRLNMLNDKPSSSCSRCYTLEQSGIPSSRESFNKKFKHKIEELVPKTQLDGSLPDMQLVYWDFRFSNICNFKCRMCGPALSSLWQEEHDKINNIKSKEKIIHINNYSVDTVSFYIDKYIDVVEEIYFAGGEPLLMDEHYYILDELLKRNRCDVYLRYNTNLSKLTYKSKNVLDYWKQFSHVHVYASFDAIGSLAEYIRHGTKWKTIENNIKKITSMNVDYFGVSSSIQIFNIFDIPDLIDRMIELGVDPNKIMITNMVTHGEQFNLQTLPKNMKEKATQKLREYQNRCNYGYIKGQIDGILNFMNTEFVGNSKEFNKILKDRTLHYDRIRSESYKKSLNKEISEWLDSL